MRTRNLAAGIPVVFAILVSSASAAAQDSTCGEDLRSLCPDAGPTRAEQMRCLRENRELLSEACRTSIVDPAARRADAGDACGDDAVRLCPGVEPGRHGTGMMNCLRSHASELSEECRNALEVLPGRKRM